MPQRKYENERETETSKARERQASHGPSWKRLQQQPWRGSRPGSSRPGWVTLIVDRSAHQSIRPMKQGPITHYHGCLARPGHCYSLASLSRRGEGVTVASKATRTDSRLAAVAGGRSFSWCLCAAGRRLAGRASTSGLLAIFRGDSATARSRLSLRGRSCDESGSFHCTRSLEIPLLHNGCCWAFATSSSSRQ
jgi:hypothetical protein